jgi:catechol 2,3-dioxygenase
MELMALQHRGIYRLGYVRLAVGDLETAVDFAVKKLGLIVHGNGSGDRVMLRCWHEAYAYTYVLERGEPRLVEIGFEVRDQEDLHMAATRAGEAGVIVTESPADDPLPDLGPSISFDVPAGPTLRLFFKQLVPGYVGGHKAIDWNVPRELRATPAPRHLAHVAVTSPDPEAVIAFLTEVLDFGVSETVSTDDGSRTLSALLFRTTEGHELAIYPGLERRLHHVAFAKEDEVEILQDGTWLVQDRVRLDVYGPTRQSYGNTFSLFFYDPLGIRYELCSGGRFTELHPDYRPVRWTESNLDRALSFYDDVENKEFLNPSL